jgi:hypothetical protein
VPVTKPAAPPAHLLQFKPKKSGTPSTTIKAKPCVNIAVKNAYGEVAAGNQLSNAGRSAAGKSTITMPISSGMTKPQRMPPSLSFSGSVNFYPFFTIKYGYVNKFNPQKPHMTSLQQGIINKKDEI